jgi:hypothetical protein
LQQAIRSCTGREISVERSNVAQDRFWVAKTFLLMSVACIVSFSIIPLILYQRLPNRLSELIGGPITAAAVMVILLAMRWWRSLDRTRPTVPAATGSEVASKNRPIRP